MSPQREDCTLPPRWELFNFCSLLTGQTERLLYIPVQNLQFCQIAELSKTNLHLQDIKWFSTSSTEKYLGLRLTNTPQCCTAKSKHHTSMAGERQALSLREASMAGLDTSGEMCSSAGQITKNNYLMPRKHYLGGKNKSY